MNIAMSIAYDDEGNIIAMAAIDVDTKVEYEYRAWEVDQGLELMRSATKIIYHDADKTTLNTVGSGLIDTAVCSRLALADKLRDIDGSKIPKVYRGSHSIEAYCYRLGVGSSFVDADQWCEEIQCQVLLFARATLRVFEKLSTKYKSLMVPDALSLEHKANRILKNQEPFTLGNIDNIYHKASSVNAQSLMNLKSIDSTFDGSDDSIGHLLTSYGWDPVALTKSGKVSTKAEHIQYADVPFIDDVINYKVSKKILEYVKTGANAWGKMARNGKLSHTCIHIGAGTHRAAHNKPNVAAIPSATGTGLKLQLGSMCRKAFGVDHGYYQMGADLKGIELRLLGHYLYPYDNGRYIDIVLNGDVHQENADALGISDRGLSKRFIYAYIYGAGFELIAQMLRVSVEDAKRMCSEFDRKLGLDKLKSAIRSKVKKQGWFKAIDGRIIFCSEPHKALNYLLQSAGAIVAKRWMVMARSRLPAGVKQMVWVHDELQYSCFKSMDSDKMRDIVVQSAKDAGEYYGLRVAIDCDVKVGRNWYDCH